MYKPHKSSNNKIYKKIWRKIKEICEKSEKFVKTFLPSYKLAEY